MEWEFLIIPEVVVVISSSCTGTCNGSLKIVNVTCYFSLLLILEVIKNLTLQ